ncbi:hypothetical protein COCON_G00197420 [Conger conger]|uniref:Oxysterol-binding protein n=1 Tax=Conger conger TaxID=82655 RepID=A0A9Q1D2A6_CONCO|nr:hypothetical protein COCON_G00197420 [Conger conger]
MAHSHQRNLHGHALNADERTATPSHRTATPSHRMATPSHRMAMPSHRSATPSHMRASSSSLRDGRPEVDSWEIIEGLKIGQTSVLRPDKHEGFMLKRRKWPLKGWHKRFFVLDNGILKYSKSPVDIQRGKMHGSIDVGLSVMSIKKRTRRIDLDTEEHIYHLKMKSQEVFDAWVCKLRHHRLYRQNEIVRSPRDATLRAFPPLASAEPPQPAPASASITEPQTLRHGASLPGAYSSGQRKVAAWLLESQEMDRCAEELTRCQSNLTELNQLLQSLEIMHRTQSAPNFADMQANSVDMSKKDKRINRRWRTKSVSKDAKMNLQVPISASLSPRRHSSNPNLCVEVVDFPTPSAHVGEPVEGATDYIKLQDHFCVIAHKVHSLLRSAFNTVAIEKEKLSQLLTEQEQAGQAAHILALRRSLSQALSQNAELRARLNRIHSESGLSEQTIITDQACDDVRAGLPLSQQVSASRLSVSESVSEFFDAQEVLLSASSSDNEGSDDESYVSDVSDNISEDNASVADNISRQMANGELTGGAFQNGRRTGLPAPSPDTSSINLWDVLRKNIGKDLSKVALPVELNEPLNTLQRLCEELEYAELLDRAAETADDYERMVIVAAFAVSGYSSTYYRAGSKPFNPLLGETYECIREDKGLCFFSEQVSHHPPISACHCESKKFTFWQDIRWKNTFWGKSMEILPIGTVHVMLPKYGDHYEWNKVTTCVHNILSGRRWMEHYGEITIRNSRNTTCICKLTFVKGNYWSSNANEVHGVVLDQEGRTVHHLFGKWHEGLYCGVPPSAKCVWRPGSMPPGCELYYGFTRFAIELNELCPEIKDLLPPTDSRFRPDQRYLEEGQVELAASEKQRMEDLQRGRRRYLEENGLMHQPRFFRKVIDAHQRERWVSNNTYWELRKNPGFNRLENPALW